MASPSPTVDPIKHSLVWTAAVIKGVITPGTIPKGGIKGFLRETGWDEKKGKGTQGATLTLTDMPPCKGSIKLQLFTPADFAAWDDFVAQVLSIDPKQQQAEGLTIYHPALSSIGLTTVVVKSYSPPEHVGKGLYHVEIHLLEWQQPPAKSVVSTPQKTAGDVPGGDAPAPVDPVKQALLDQIKKMKDAAAAPNP